MRVARCVLPALLVLPQLGALTAAHAQDEQAWRVLLVYSYGRDYAPHDSVGAEFRRDLVRRAARPVEFYEVSVDTTRGVRTQDADDAPLTQFLVARVAAHHPDLVVTLGAPAARFVLPRRARLFPSIPMLVGAVDPRMLDTEVFGPQDAVVSVRIAVIETMHTILALRPATRNVMVILGASANEMRWREVLEREFSAFKGRTFTWTNDLSLKQMRSAVSALPPDSVILYGVVTIDAAGLSFEQDVALQRLHEVARVPMFGLYESQLGKGIVGGPLMSLDEVGRAVADSTLRLLTGSPATALAHREINATRMLFDWRELNRWKIPESSLPAGSVVQFRPTTVWEQHGPLIAAGVAIILLQAAFIVALVIQRNRRRWAEEEARDLNRRLLSANEDERSRLARDLHDDFSHRLARLSFDIANLEHAVPTGEGTQSLRQMRQELSQLSEDIHAVSHQLHPSVLEDLGLVDALRTEGELLARSSRINVIVNINEVSAEVAPDVALCAFRVTQEALRNVGRHAQATSVNVSAHTLNGHLHLAIRDDGVGFDLEAQRQQHRASLGHASMRERVRLLGGVIQIRSTPGSGTTIETQLPLGGRTS